MIACNLWAAIANEGYTLHCESSESNGLVFAQLTEYRTQGQSFPDGWALMFYEESYLSPDGQLVRSAVPTSESFSLFDSTVSTMMLPANNVNLAVGHLRVGTSGALGIPDPHPFLYGHNGTTYSLVHNGTLSKDVLLSLLTEDNTDSLWISNHAPNTYGNGHWSGEGWEFVVDSELYFLWIMKNIEELEYNVVAGLTQALSTLNTYIPGCSEKTIIFSDGSSLYLYGAANNLNYTDGATALEAPYADILLHHKAVMTVPPTEGIASYMSWVSIEDNQLVVLTDGDVATSMVEALPSSGSPILPNTINLYQNYPNPFNPTTTIQYELWQETVVKLVIYDLAGREVSVLLDGKQQPGLKNIKWNASSFAGGIYIFRLETPSDRVSGKMVLLK